MKKILITGGAGFIGSNLAAKLAHQGHSVRVLDNLSPQIHGSKDSSPLYQSVLKHAEFIEGDVRDRDILAVALRSIDIVVHLAAETGTGQSMYELHRYIDVNCTGTGALLEAIQSGKHDIEKIVLSSSRAVYGEGKYLSAKNGVVYPGLRSEAQLQRREFELTGPDGEPLTIQATDEVSKITPLSIYAATKFHQEQYISLSCQSMKIPYVIYRYQNVYGPGQSLKNPYTGILSIFSTQIKNGNNLNIFEDGLESRDFVYIDDVVEATALGINKQEADNEIFNVGSGVATPVIKVAETLKRLYNAPVNIGISGNYRLGDIRHNFADLSKINHLLGFTPAVNFETGIGQFVEWVNTQRVEKDNLQQSLNEMAAKGLLKK